jgi:acetyl esterase/lipase
MSKAFLVVLNGDKARGEAYSPARHWSAGAPPTLVLVGADEPPIAAVRSFGERWRAEGARIELFVADGAPHGFFAQPRWIEDTLARTVRFLAALGL